MRRGTGVANAADLTGGEAHLVRHAVAMGGWLTATYFNHYASGGEGYNLVEKRGLFVFQLGPVPIYRLTEAGQQVADQMAAA